MHNKPPQNLVALNNHNHLFCSCVCTLGRTQRKGLPVSHAMSAGTAWVLNSVSLTRLSSEFWQPIMALGWEPQFLSCVPTCGQLGLLQSMEPGFQGWASWDNQKEAAGLFVNYPQKSRSLTSTVFYCGRVHGPYGFKGRGLSLHLLVG